MSRNMRGKRRAINACTVCTNKCERSSSFICNNCVEHTHALCIGMPDEIIREFQRKTMKFYCPVCISEPKKRESAYDWRKSLKRYVTFHCCQFTDVIESRQFAFNNIIMQLANLTRILSQCI